VHVLRGLKPLEDSYRQLRRDAGTSIESDGTNIESGGINIESAKRRLQQQDRVDKKLFQDRIQQQHRVCLLVFYSYYFDIIFLNLSLHY